MEQGMSAKARQPTLNHHRYGLKAHGVEKLLTVQKLLSLVLG